jgi:hypothetical protein
MRTTLILIATSLVMVTGCVPNDKTTKEVRMEREIQRERENDGLRNVRNRGLDVDIDTKRGKIDVETRKERDLHNYLENEI